MKKLRIEISGNAFPEICIGESIDMEIKNDKIDGGKAFDGGKTSSDYAKYRDIYPEIFYEKIVKRNLCISGQKILDLGTGTGVLPRNMYHYGAEWTGVDISENQITELEQWDKEHKKLLSQIAPEEFDILHYAALAELCVKKEAAL